MNPYPIGGGGELLKIGREAFVTDLLGYKFIRVSKDYIASKEHGLLKIKYIGKDFFAVLGAVKTNPLMSAYIDTKQILNIDLMDKNIEILFGDKNEINRT